MDLRKEKSSNITVKMNIGRFHKPTREEEVEMISGIELAATMPPNSRTNAFNELGYCPARQQWSNMYLDSVEAGEQ